MANSVIAWRLHYEDGTIIEGQDAFPSDIPKDGCVGLLLVEANLKSDGTNYKNALTGADYYFCQPEGGPLGHIYGCDNDRRDIDVASEIATRYPGAVIVRGKWTDLETLEAITTSITQG